MNRGAHEDSGLPRPTAAELRILRALWRLGPSTVRQVHEALPARSTTGYTTVLKFLQIMYQKGLVERDDTQRAARPAGVAKPLSRPPGHAPVASGIDRDRQPITPRVTHAY